MDSIETFIGEYKSHLNTFKEKIGEGDKTDYLLFLTLKELRAIRLKLADIDRRLFDQVIKD